MSDLPRLEDLPLHPGSRVLLRADFNVPLSDGAVGDDLRIRAALPTISWLRERGAAVIACSHLGRPKGEPDPKLSLAPVASRLGELIGAEVALAPEVVGERASELGGGLEAGGELLLENVRFHPGETKNAPELVAALSALADAYVDDAFGAVHRAHASVVGPPTRLPSAGGRLLSTELEVLSRLRTAPARPFVTVLGGAKVSDKLGVLTTLVDRCDAVLVGGAMCFTFLMAQGLPVGRSLVEPDFVDECRRLLDTGKVRVPTDVVVATEIRDGVEAWTVSVKEIPDGTMGLDIGPDTAAAYGAEIGGAATVFWNGPMGVFEIPAFAGGTRGVGEAVADAPGFTVVGGGDVVSAVRHLGLAGRIDHVSTGGGASLEYLEQGDLPGLAALRKSSEGRGA